MSEVRHAAEAFASSDASLLISPLGEGHIHDSYMVRAQLDPSTQPLVLQRINRSVFSEPERIVRNAARITAHLRERAEAQGRCAAREVLRLARTRDGKLWFRDAKDEIWRAFMLIEGATPALAPRHPSEAHAIGRAFGRFLRDLEGFPPDELYVSLPDLHNGSRYLKAFGRALSLDPLGRVAGATREIAEIEARRAVVEARFDELPDRVIHGDTKINNVLLDIETGEGLCVIDLDTVMLAPAVLDLGNFLRSVLRRTGSAVCGEIDRGISFFESGLRGYRDGVGELLGPSEWGGVVEAMRTTAMVLVVRFVTDYIEGDRYFRVARADDNLLRCREQLDVVGWIEAHAHRLRGSVEAVLEAGE